jgi:tRNA pseudouridine55 synthase
VLPPAPVRLLDVSLREFSGDEAVVSLTTSSGYYVRALVHSLGQTLGCGACLAALRRTRSGRFDLAQAVRLEDLASRPERLIPLAGLLVDVPAVTLTAEGRTRVSHGRPVNLAQTAGGAWPAAPWLRLVDVEGALVAVARPLDAGALHPEVVLI